jgi:diguanylate cyclase (GGDEF)-like protein
MGDSLYISSCNRNPIYQSDSITEQFFLRLSIPPTGELIEQVKNILYSESEISDPELLRRHNDSIREEMKLSKKRAAQELCELEEKLEQKRNQLHESIRQAEIDSLTNILNRGAYDRRLQESVSACQEQQLPLSLVLLDLDYFKQVNDTYGHQAGDEILKKMARSMTQNTRKKMDYVCRMGGDEFAIICFSNTAIASRSAYKILEDMKGKVSIGISLLKADDDVESLVARTDEALYEAKEKGRGQVIING